LGRIDFWHRGSELETMVRGLDYTFKFGTDVKDELCRRSSRE